MFTREMRSTLFGQPSRNLCQFRLCEVALQQKRCIWHERVFRQSYSRLKNILLTKRMECFRRKEDDTNNRMPGGNNACGSNRDRLVPAEKVRVAILAATESTARSSHDRPSLPCQLALSNFLLLLKCDVTHSVYDHSIACLVLASA